ncbi:MAG TPA: ABC transporter permease [Gaiellaceae bacterium]|nr:ABC transporter permease [Gaiellaceae bacterium]
MSPRGRYALRRVALAVPTLLAMTIFVFLIIRLVPGDPVRTMLGFRATPENVATIRHDLRLDESWPAQYGAWLGGLVRGDLGEDYISHASVSGLLGQRLPVTLELTLFSLALALLVGVPLGVVAATGGRASRWLTATFTIGGISIPDFWLGTLLVLVFAAKLGWLPPTGYASLFHHPVENLRYMTLPVVTLAIGEAAYILRTTRASMQETLGRPFVTFLRARGLRERSVVYRHALRTASLPIVTVVGIQFGVLLGGAIVIETVFGLPGVGKLVVTAINQRNYTVVQGSVLVIAALFIVVNLVTDLLYGWLDPRVEARLGR